MGGHRPALRCRCRVRRLSEKTLRPAASGHSVAAQTINQKGIPMTTDKTGAETTLSAEDGRYTIAVAGEDGGVADFCDRGEQRVFHHTEIDPASGGRGL